MVTWYPASARKTLDVSPVTPALRSQDCQSSVDNIQVRMSSAYPSTITCGFDVMARYINEEAVFEKAWFIYGTLYIQIAFPFAELRPGGGTSCLSRDAKHGI